MPELACPSLPGLAPLVDERCQVLILGSFPGAASLKAQQYYGYPQNQFWRILMDVLPVSADMSITSSYQKRSDWLLHHGLGLWDIYSACDRQGSLDKNIRQAELNDIQVLRRRCPRLQAILHNGAESYKHHRHTSALGLPVHKLPSTSPAHATMAFARKRDEWRSVLGLYLNLKREPI